MTGKLQPNRVRRTYLGAERFTPSGRRIPDVKMHGGIGWEKMFDVYGYEGCPLEEVCARYVRTAESLGGRMVRDGAVFLMDALACGFQRVCRYS